MARLKTIRLADQERTPARGALAATGLPMLQVHDIQYGRGRCLSLKSEFSRVHQKSAHPEPWQRERDRNTREGA